MSGTSRHAFLGGNTPRGFFSYFHHLIRLDTARRLFVIKGGPGSGKSHFMRTIGEFFLASGYNIEFFHCASDPDSLDAVHIPALKVAWVDGTHPHVIDPQHPGLVDVIVDFGRYCNDAALQSQKSFILSTQEAVTNGFRRAFGYLRAARNVYDVLTDLNRSAVDLGQHNEVTEGLIDRILGNRTVGRVMGYRRQLFAEAITPAGVTHFLPTLMDKLTKRFILRGEPGTGKSKVLANLADAAQAHGFDIETYQRPLDPQAIDHLIIPALNVGVISVTDPEDSAGQTNDYMINLDELRSFNRVQRDAKARDTALTTYRQLLDLAVQTLAETTRIRDGLEAVYIKAMDFAAIDALREEHIQWVLQIAEQ